MTSYEIKQMLDIVRGDSSLKERFGKVLDREHHDMVIEKRFEALEVANKDLTARIEALEKKA